MNKKENQLYHHFIILSLKSQSYDDILVYLERLITTNVFLRNRDKVTHHHISIQIYKIINLGVTNNGRFNNSLRRI